MAPFARPYATFYWSAIVNSSIVYHFVSYFTLNTIVTLKSGLEVTASVVSLKLMPFKSLGTVSYSPCLDQSCMFCTRYLAVFPTPFSQLNLNPAKLEAAVQTE